ncbi:hypothetical protein PEDI_25630 [Persicobacter diffluens]|uniref:Transposase n=1 Tax=Persicobacter diffluens TaxID=981 RepID=A0AAN4VZN1_9BACT|nr:hypothetical protein PEDI_25630 [Persicobacter diffluens]
MSKVFVHLNLRFFPNFSVFCLVKYWESEWCRLNFLFCYKAGRGRDFDNNGSERAIRNIKTKLKVSGGFRSISGADCYAVIRSAIDTFAKQGFEVFDKLRMSLMMAYSL